MLLQESNLQFAHIVVLFLLYELDELDELDKLDESFLLFPSIARLPVAFHLPSLCHSFHVFRHGSAKYASPMALVAPNIYLSGNCIVQQWMEPC